MSCLLQLSSNEQFWKFIELVGTLLGVLVGLITICLTAGILYVAKQALNTWKEQKEFEIDVEAMSYMIECIDVLTMFDPRLFALDEFSATETEAGNKLNETNKELLENYVHERSVQKNLNPFRERIRIATSNNIKVSRYSKNQLLKDFYNNFTYYITLIPILARQTYIHRINKLITDLNIPSEVLPLYKTFPDFDYDLEPDFEKYIDNCNINVIAPLREIYYALHDIKLTKGKS